jgi:hypothetical protein
MESNLNHLVEFLTRDRATTAGVCFLAWLGTVRLLRYRTRDKKYEKYGYKTPESFKNMSVDDAWDIQRYVLGTEFPWIGEKALQFALFR